MTKAQVEKAIEIVNASRLKHGKVRALKIKDLFLSGKARRCDLLELEQLKMAAEKS